MINSDRNQSTDTVTSDEYHQYVPGRLTDTLERENSNDIKIVSGVTSAVVDKLHIPPAEEWMMTVNRQGSFKGNWRVDGKPFYNGAVGPSQWILIDHRSEIDFSSEPMPGVGSCDFSYSFLFFPKNLINRAAHQTLEIDPASLEMMSQVGTYDSLLLRLLETYEQREGNHHSRLYFESVSQLLAIHMLERYCSKRTVVTARKYDIRNRLNLAIEYMQANLDKDISLCELSAASSLSDFYFIKAFKGRIGLTPYQYLTKLRVEKAKSLLATTKLSITDVAIEVGYCSQSHFTKVFKDIVGTTPRKFRFG